MMIESLGDTRSESKEIKVERRVSYPRRMISSISYLHSIVRLMNTLFVDLASSKQTMAIVTDEAALASVGIESRTGEEVLLPTIDSLLATANLQYKDLHRIASTTGPGGFMSLRVGISLVNALSSSLHIPLAGIHLSDVWKERTTEETMLWAHSTKQSLLFIRGFGNLEKKWPEPALISVGDLGSALTEKTPYVGELIDSQQDQLPHLQSIDTLQPLETILPRILNSLSYTKNPLLPWYGRGA